MDVVIALNVHLKMVKMAKVFYYAYFTIIKKQRFPLDCHPKAPGEWVFLPLSASKFRCKRPQRSLTPKKENMLSHQMFF